MNKKRKQLTLFIDANSSASIEKVRCQFNPQQYELIKAHVTLCREDELEEIEKVMQNLNLLQENYLALDFGKVVRFAEGKGVLIPCIGKKESFQQLRKGILQNIIEEPREQEPHITLLHPRNATCTNEIFAQIEKITFPNRLKFRKISLIEQEIGQPWRVLQEFELQKPSN